MKRYIREDYDDDLSEADLGLPVTYRYEVYCPYRIEYIDEDTHEPEEIPGYDYEVFDEVEELVNYINTDIFNNEFDEIMKEDLNYNIHKYYSEKVNVFDVKQHLECRGTTDDIYWIIDVNSDMYPEYEFGEIINDRCQAQLADGWGEDMGFSEEFFTPIEMEYYEDYSDEDDEDYDEYDTDTYEAPLSLQWQWQSTKTHFVTKL